MPESRKQWKDAKAFAEKTWSAKAKKAGVSGPFPLKFDKDFGPLLVKLDKAYKAVVTEDEEDAKDLLVASGKKVAKTYRKLILEHQAELDKVDPAIAARLNEGLDTVERLLNVYLRTFAAEIKVHIKEYKTAAKTWADGKKKSVKAYKEMITLTDKARERAKANRLTKWPFEFNYGLAPTLTSISDKMKTWDQSAGKDIGRARDVLSSYEHQVQRLKTVMKEAELDTSISGTKINEVFEPLEEGLAAVKSALSRTSKAAN
jgi:hypothetical protein